MRAIRQQRFGPPEELRYEEVADPIPREGQVLIAVEAAGVHFVDTVIRRGGADGPFLRPELPMVPGREVAGMVDAVGPGVDASWLGRRVVAHLGMAGGGYAEQALVTIGALHQIPPPLGAEEAVAMIGTGRTALAILDAVAPIAQDVVVVTAAASGLGSLLVQAVRNVGAAVVGLAGGPAKVERARALGAAVAADYLQADWPDRVREGLAGRQVSLVLDGVGGAPGRAAVDLLGEGGRLVVFGAASGEPVTLTTWDLMGRGLTATALRRPAELRGLEARALAEAAAGRLVPLVQRFPLAAAAAAHAAIEARATVGKVVLVPGRGAPRPPDPPDRLAPRPAELGLARGADDARGGRAARGRLRRQPDRGGSRRGGRGGARRGVDGVQQDAGGAAVPRVPPRSGCSVDRPPRRARCGRGPRRRKDPWIVVR
jgi:NADPH2:quinone reductase